MKETHTEIGPGSPVWLPWVTKLELLYGGASTPPVAALGPIESTFCQCLISFNTITQEGREEERKGRKDGSKTTVKETLGGGTTSSSRCVGLC